MVARVIYGVYVVVGVWHEVSCVCWDKTGRTCGCWVNIWCICGCWGSIGRICGCWDNSVNVVVGLT